MDTKNINLFVFDTHENFESSKKFLGVEKINFKSFHRVDGVNDFKSVLDELESNELIFMAIHVFSNDEVSGVKLYAASGLKKAFPRMGSMYISDGNAVQIKHAMVDAGLDTTDIYKYHQVQTLLEAGKMAVLTKSEILSAQSSDRRNGFEQHEFPQFDYGIITALYQDEFEEVERFFEFPEDVVFRTGNKTYLSGFLKSNPEKKVIAAFQNSTGMVEAGILATHMIELFRPKYILMSGVCGGTPDHKFGDIIVAKQIFTFQKGKISDIRFKDSAGHIKKIELFNKDSQLVDYDQLYDNDGNKIQISVEKFEIEQESILNLDTVLEDRINRKLRGIADKINKEIREKHFFNDHVLKIEIEPMACSTMVINKEGYFEDTIKIVNRKTAAVEMESYGVARACHFANNGKTKPIIFKSVMDHTHKKADMVGNTNWKKFAAYTSAHFMAALFEENVI